jgi:hypothetical protein
MDKKYREKILKKYLGLSPVWFDLRKKEILKDNIDISQWQINMNFMIYKYGTIDSSEQKALEECLNNLVDTETDEFEFEEHLERNVTPVLRGILDGNLPPIFYKNQDRNWFLAAYPDVFGYFYPQPNLLADDFDKEMLRVEEHVKNVTEDHKRMERYISTGKGNQTIYLVRMKNFFHYELGKTFALCRI